MASHYYCLYFISIYILCLTNMNNAQSSNNITIKFPFCIKHDVNNNQPLSNSSCKSPEFNLYQNDKLGFTIELGNAGNFTVDEITYSSKEIKLSDPNHCLPLKLLSLDFDSITTFVPVIQTNKIFWVYNCSRIIGQYQGYDVIGCVNGGSIGYTVVSVESGGVNNVNETECKFLKKVYVSDDNGYYDELSSYSSIELTWDETNNCDSSCESMDNTSDPPSSNNNDNSNTAASRVKWLLVVGAIALFAITFRVLWIWLLPQYLGRNNNIEPPNTTTNNTTNHQTDHELIGLNQSIMNSYPTVVIGKSGRGIKPPDDTCPICLGDYVPGDTLKILPECIHRFHVECIDVWLTANATCPICRISPSHHNFSVA